METPTFQGESELELTSLALDDLKRVKDSGAAWSAKLQSVFSRPQTFQMEGSDPHRFSIHGDRGSQGNRRQLDGALNSLESYLESRHRLSLEHDLHLVWTKTLGLYDQLMTAGTDRIEDNISKADLSSIEENTRARHIHQDSQAGAHALQRDVELHGRVPFPQDALFHRCERRVRYSHTMMTGTKHLDHGH